MINLALIGYGYWGTKLLRNFLAQERARVTAVADVDSTRLAQLKISNPAIKITSNARELIESPDVDGIIIATPVQSHFSFALNALEQGKHVLIEKPMAASLQEAKKLSDLALSTGKVLMVDHTFLYTGAIQKIKTLLDAGEAGPLRYIDSTRINLGLPQSEVNVLWDLAPHDISIINYLTGKAPDAVRATGVCAAGNDVENIAYITLLYPDNLVAHINCSWVSPIKVRQMIFGGSKQTIVYNDAVETDKVRVFNYSSDHATNNKLSLTGSELLSAGYYAPAISAQEALFAMAKDFINAIEGKGKPVSDFESGLKVMAALEAAQHSLRNGGREVLVR